MASGRGTARRRTRTAAVLACAAVAAVCVHAAPSQDEVLALPGWTGELPSRTWSGFLDVGAAVLSPRL